MKDRIICLIVDFLFWQKVFSVKFDKPVGRILSAIMGWNYKKKNNK